MFRPDESAVCWGRDTELYLSANLPKDDRDGAAQRLCHGCPIMRRCAQDAIDTKSTHYVRAGVPLDRAGPSLNKEQNRRLEMIARGIEIEEEREPEWPI